MKKQEETRKAEQETKNKAIHVPVCGNFCIACGREIPEGMLVCMKCEVGNSQERCVICDRPIAEGQDICSNCRAAIFRSKNKD